jgi:hypothetical protein
LVDYREKRLWLSDIFFLNDAKELAWGREIFVCVLRQSHGRFDDDFRYVMAATVFGVDFHARPFVGSFSANGDLLSQLRAYAADGTGFALGPR